MNRGASLAVALIGLAAASRAVARPDRSPPPPLDREATEPSAAKAPPPAAQRRTIGILDVRVDGVSDDVRVTFERNLELQLDTNHYWLATRGQMRDRMKFSTKWTEGCLLGTCLAEVRTQTNAQLVLLAALSGSGTSFGYVVTVLRTDTGHVIAQESSRCDVCTVNEAMTEATLTTLRLLNGVPDTLPDEAGDQGAAVELAVNPLKKQLAASARHASRLGITLTTLGIVTAGVGAAVYVLADKPRYSYVVAGAGGGLLLGGVFALTF